MGNSTVTYGTKFEFFQLCARALTTSHQINFACLCVERKRESLEIERKRDGESVFMCSEIERSR